MATHGANRPHPRVPLLYIEDLSTMVCSNPGCTEPHHDQPLFIRSHCHPRAGTLAVFEPGSDHLHMVCATCERGITTLALAHRPPQEDPDA